ncbi:hypothetical protein RB195_012219 [Necator americanus]
MGLVCIPQSVCGLVYCGLPRRISRNRRRVSGFIDGPLGLQLRRQSSPLSLAPGPSTQLWLTRVPVTSRSLSLKTKEHLTKRHRQQRRGPRRPSGMAVFAS